MGEIGCNTKSTLNVTRPSVNEISVTKVYCHKSSCTETFISEIISADLISLGFYENLKVQTLNICMYVCIHVCSVYVHVCISTLSIRNR